MTFATSQQKYAAFDNENYTNGGKNHLEKIVSPINVTTVYNWARVFRIVFSALLVMIFLHISFFCITNMTREQACFGKNCQGVNVFIYNGRQPQKNWPNPPPHKEVAKVARYVMHISEWGSLATTSTHKNIDGFPFTNIFSVSDGPFENSTGVPYFFLTPLELSVQDLEADNKTSLTVSLAQSDFCAKYKMDPEDPRCAHVVFSGHMVKLQNGSEEETFARKALFSRHWEMATWPAVSGHAWFFAKLDIKHIYILDYFGGAISVDVNEYYNSSFDNPNINRFSLY